jgi:CheY-like chemotaxis protein/HPt (histidine-containing phosphotransfer) domain-containing protein
VLLAEDSLVNQKVAVGLLEKQGHTVVVARNGKEAIAALQREPFDLVLMDVEMPEMDGLEATAVIRVQERQAGGHVPIIAMTAHAMQGDRERCLAAGMDGYLAKPIRAEELSQTIQDVLGAWGLAHTRVGGPKSEPADADWREALRAVGEDRELLRTVVESLVADAPRLVVAVRQAALAGDARALRQAVHALKGSIRYWGSTPAFQSAARLERMGEQDDLSGAAKTAAELENEMERLTGILVDYIERDARTKGTWSETGVD